MEEVKIVIIGAGVVGLAIAAELSREHKDIVVLKNIIVLTEDKYL